jgi:hypothetical protein
MLFDSGRMLLGHDDAVCKRTSIKLSPTPCHRTHASLHAPHLQLLIGFHRSYSSSSSQSTSFPRVGGNGFRRCQRNVPTLIALPPATSSSLSPQHSPHRAEFALRSSYLLGNLRISSVIPRDEAAQSPFARRHCHCGLCCCRFTQGCAAPSAGE